MQTFMICSLLSTNKDIATMIPVKKLNASYLTKLTRKVSNKLENEGYFVLLNIR